MQYFLDFLKKLFSNISKYLNFIFITIIGLLIILLSIKQCSLDKSNRNVQIFKDSTTYHYNKAKQLYAQNNALVIDNKQLKDFNSELYNEVNNLKEHPLVITKTETKINYDTIKLYSNISSYFDKLGNKNFILKWNMDTLYNVGNSFKINGTSVLIIDTLLNNISNYTLLNNLEIKSKLFLSFTEEDKKLHINVRSDYPNLSFSDVEGAIIDPQKSKVLKEWFIPKKWGIGPSIDIGLGSNFKPQIFVGFGIQYNFIRF